MDWTITSVNEGNAPASEYKAVGKVPAGTQFVAGSAKADGAVVFTYSIDNGKSFSASSYRGRTTGRRLRQESCRSGFHVQPDPLRMVHTIE